METEQLAGKLHGWIDQIAREAGCRNVDHAWVLSEVDQRLANLNMQLRAQGFSDAEARESLAKHDALGFLMKSAVGAWKTREGHGRRAQGARSRRGLARNSSSGPGTRSGVWPR